MSQSGSGPEFTSPHIQRAVARLVDEAEEALDNGDLEAAADLLLDALALDPEKADAADLRVDVVDALLDRAEEEAALTATMRRSRCTAWC